MALPVILFDTSLGADDYTTSGAGPSTAIAGTVAYGNGTHPTKVGLYESTAPDLSGIAVDGSHALHVDTGSTNRKWYGISAKTDVQVTTTGDITTGTAALTVADATGLAAGDLIRVAGAGVAGADLYSSIYGVVGTTVTLNNNASTTVTGAAVTRPKMLTLVTSMAATSGPYAWAIGGLRGALVNNIDLLQDDVLPGWTLRLVGGQTHDLSAEAPLTLDVAGTSSGGRITLDASGTEPAILVGTGSDPIFYLRVSYWTFRNLKWSTATEGLYLDNDNCRDVLVQDCQADTVTNLYRVSSSVTGGRVRVSGGKIWNCTTCFKVDGILDDLTIENILAASASYVVAITTATPLRFLDSVCYAISSDAINLGSASGQAAASSIERCDFQSLSAKAIVAGHVDRCRGLVVRNCRLDSFTYHIDLPTGGGNVAAILDYNKHVDSAKLNNCEIGSHSWIQSGSQSYRDAAGYDFRVTQLADRAKGWPASIPGASTYSYQDPGYAQRREPAGGTIPVRITAVQDYGEWLEVTVIVLEGTNIGLVIPVNVLKSGYGIVDVPLSDAVAGAVQAFMRDGAMADLVGMEVLA